MVVHAFFYKNGEIFSEPRIFLTCISYLSDFRPTLPEFYVLKMIVSILRFIWNRLLSSKTSISSFSENIFTKSQPRYSYRVYSNKKKRVGW